MKPADLDRISEVLPYLCIGSYGAAEKVDYLQEQRVTHLVCLLDQFPGAAKSLPHLCLPMSDHGETDLQRILHDSVPFIAGAKEAGGRVLIFCALGVNRSPSLVAAYLRSELGYSTEEALSKITASRPFVSLHDKYLSQLDRLDGRARVLSDVDNLWKSVVWPQFGAAIDMLENALLACPEDLWNDRSQRPEFWYVVYHTLFFLDLYLSGSVEEFTPPAPFNLDELDSAGLLPERPYTKDELHGYLVHGRGKCRAAIEALTDEKAGRRCGFEWLEVNEAELLLYNMRHVQHHAAQLNLILRQKIDSSPRWVARAKAE